MRSMRPMEDTAGNSETDQGNFCPNGPSTVNMSRVYPNRRVTQQQNRSQSTQYVQQQLQEPTPIPMCYIPAVQAEAQRLPCGCIAYIPQVQQQRPPVAMMMPIQAQQTFIEPMQLVQPAPLYYGLHYQVLPSPPPAPQTIFATPQAMPTPQIYGAYQQPMPAGAAIQQPGIHYAQINRPGPHPVAVVYPMHIEVDED